LKAVGISEATVQLDPPEILEDTTQVTVNLTIPVNIRNGYLLPRIFLGKEVFKSVTMQREGKSEETSLERLQRDGVRNSDNKAPNKPKKPKDKPKKDNSGKGNADDD
jgi:hypothetical protein